MFISLSARLLLFLDFSGGPSPPADLLAPEPLGPTAPWVMDLVQVAGTGRRDY